MKYKIKNRIIKCEVDEAEEQGVGLIKDRSGIKGILKRFIAYNQVGAYSLPKRHGLKKGDKVIVKEIITIIKNKAQKTTNPKKDSGLNKC